MHSEVADHGYKLLLVSFFAFIGLAFAQGNSLYCDAFSGICYQGYTDTTLNITVGFILPPLSTGTTPNSTEFLGEIIAPVSYGYTGVSMAGTMADSLLFVIWPYNGQVIFSTRWTSGYVQPTAYAGPVITLLPDSTVNDTYIKASFRCQNCTVWESGSLGGGDLNGFELIAYVAQTTTPVDDPSDPDSDFIEHDQFDFYGFELDEAHTSAYSSYLPTATSAPSSVPTTASVTSTSSASVPTQTTYGQCGGDGWTGPTACATGSTCVALSPPYYSQCQPA